MGKLPYSRVVNVTLTRNDAFPARSGFGVALLLTNVAIAGVLDATHRTKVYGNMEEAAVDHAANTEVYAALESAFSQNPRPLQVKVGYIDFVPVTIPADDPNPEVPASTAAELKAELDNLADADLDWYWLCITKSMRDVAALDGLVEWVEAKNKFDILDSNDAATETSADTTSLAGRNKAEFERSAVFYHTDPDEQGAIALAASLGTRNFDEAESAYTAKFKRLVGVAPVNLGSAKVQAITGFTPALGQSTSAGNMANTYIDIGGRSFVVEGSTLTPNVFIDEIHATDWIIARTEEETLGILLNNDRIPYTDAGMETLASGARTVMRQAARAGLIANDLDPETGDYSPAVEFTIPSVFDVPESQRKARIAPEMSVRFRYAGAVHYTTINYRMTF